jgi:hypothetical protein
MMEAVHSSEMSVKFCHSTLCHIPEGSTLLLNLLQFYMLYPQISHPILNAEKRIHLYLKKKTPWLLVLKRTIPTERPPLVGEVSANFLWIEGVTWSAQRITTAVNLSFRDRSRYFSIQVAPQLSSRG